MQPDTAADSNMRSNNHDQAESLNAWVIRMEQAKMFRTL